MLVLTLHATSYDWKFVNTSGTEIKDSGTTVLPRPGTASASVAAARVARAASPP